MELHTIRGIEEARIRVKPLIFLHFGQTGKTHTGGKLNTLAEVLSP
jgi:hypothetical protein